MKQPKKLMRNSRFGKVLTPSMQQAAALRSAKARKNLHIDFETHSLNINVIPDRFGNGPYRIETVTVMRKRNGETVEVSKRAVLDGSNTPILFGPRKWLDKQLIKYELGYARWIMTRGTAAEGL